MPENPIHLYSGKQRKVAIFAIRPSHNCCRSFVCKQAILRELQEILILNFAIPKLWAWKRKKNVIQIQFSRNGFYALGLICIVSGKDPYFLKAEHKQSKDSW